MDRLALLALIALYFLPLFSAKCPESSVCLSIYLSIHPSIHSSSPPTAAPPGGSLGSCRAKGLVVVQRDRCSLWDRDTLAMAACAPGLTLSCCCAHSYTNRHGEVTGVFYLCVFWLQRAQMFRRAEIWLKSTLDLLLRVGGCACLFVGGVRCNLNLNAGGCMFSQWWSLKINLESLLLAKSWTK